MPIVPLKKVDLLALNSDREYILKRLQAYSTLHINKIEDMNEFAGVDYDENNALLDKLNSKMSALQSAIKRIQTYDERKKILFSPKAELSLEEFEVDIKNMDTTYEYVQQSQKNHTRRNEIKSELIRLNSTRLSIIPYSALDIDIERIEDTPSCEMHIGTIPSLEYQEFEAGCNEIDKLEVIKFNNDSDYVYVLIIYHNIVNEQMQSLMLKTSFDRASFPFIEGNAKDYLHEIDDQISELSIENKELIAKEKKLAIHLDDLERLHDALSLQIDSLEQVEKFANTQYTFSLEGWIPEHETENFETLIKECTSSYELVFTDGEKDEMSPTLYDNPPIIEPIEMVTNMFATPKPGTIDPNVVMAPFFGIFFGMMLSDAGYGLVLALIAGFLYYRTKPSKGRGNSLLALLALSGIFTIFWGIMYGGFMGYSIRPIMFNPLDEPMLTLGLSLLMGVIHILVGMGVRAAMFIKRKQLMSAISQQFTWMTLLVGLVMFAFPMLHSFVDKVPSQAAIIIGEIGKYLLIIATIGILTLGGHGKKGIGRIFGGISQLANITGYASDILSYSRLFGLGLATAVIGMVVNNMVTMLATNVFGWIMAIIVFIGAHIFNIAINTLGAYVHSSRLQYVEFFGKFFEDGGIPYNKFEPRTKYFNIK